MSSSQSDQGRPTRLPWIALAVVAAVAVGVVFAYFGAQRAEEGQQQERAERREARAPVAGNACEALTAAGEAFDDGDEEVLKELVTDAEQLAIEALNTTGLKFGRPERMALYLGAEELGSPRSQERIERRLDLADQSCTELKS